LINYSPKIYIEEVINLEIKKTKALLWISKSKIETNFSSIQTCSLCPKQISKILLVILLLTQRKIF